jgi:stearoyl-CoA desaturase (delta-9 desaturase)
VTGVVSWAWLPLFLLALSTPIALGVVFYHRILTHRSARISPLIEYPLVVMASPAGTPIGWVGNHRYHHQVTDQPADPHAPGHHGFWVAHAGWYLHTTSTTLSVLYTFAGPFRTVFDAFWRPRTGMDHAHLAKDLYGVPFYRWLSRPGPYAGVVLTHVTVMFALTAWLFGLAALPILYVITVAYYALGDWVNSLCHRYGRRPFRSRDESTNLAWLAAITMGEGFHHNHHVFPTSVRAGVLPGQIDTMYLFCRALERLGLASNLRQPTLEQLLARVEDPGARRRLEARAIRRVLQPG